MHFATHLICHAGRDSKCLFFLHYRCICNKRQIHPYVFESIYSVIVLIIFVSNNQVLVIIHVQILSTKDMDYSRNNSKRLDNKTKQFHLTSYFSKLIKVDESIVSNYCLYIQGSKCDKVTYSTERDVATQKRSLYHQPLAIISRRHFFTPVFTLVTSYPSNHGDVKCQHVDTGDGRIQFHNSLIHPTHLRIIYHIQPKQCVSI